MLHLRFLDARFQQREQQYGCNAVDVTSQQGRSAEIPRRDGKRGPQIYCTLLQLSLPIALEATTTSWRVVKTWQDTCSAPPTHIRGHGAALGLELQHTVLPRVPEASQGCYRRGRSSRCRGRRFRDGVHVEGVVVTAHNRGISGAGHLARRLAVASVDDVCITAPALTGTSRVGQYTSVGCATQRVFVEPSRK